MKLDLAGSAEKRDGWISRLRIIGVAFLVSIGPVAGRADHAPEWQVSTRKPETILAGVHVGTTSIDGAKKLFGAPTRSQDLPDFPGAAEYVWEQPGLRVELGTFYNPEHRTGKEEVVYSVSVSGAKAPVKYSTGGGIKIGDDLRALIRAYGPVYLTSWRPPTVESTTFSFSVTKPSCRRASQTRARSHASP